jgi:hypothetical protein
MYIDNKVANVRNVTVRRLEAFLPGPFNAQLVTLLSFFTTVYILFQFVTIIKACHISLKIFFINTLLLSTLNLSVSQFMSSEHFRTSLQKNFYGICNYLFMLIVTVYS